MFVAASGLDNMDKNENKLDPRFVSLFSIYQAKELTNEVLFSIYSNILMGHMSYRFNQNFLQDIRNIVQLSINVYEYVNYLFSINCTLYQ